MCKEAEECAYSYKLMFSGYDKAFHSELNPAVINYMGHTKTNQTKQQQQLQKTPS